MKKSIPWVAVLALVALLVIAASLPKYVGRFCGDGSGLTNVGGPWSSNTSFIWPSGQPAPDPTGVTPGPAFFFSPKGFFFGTNVTQDWNPLSASRWIPMYAISLTDSNEPPTLSTFLGAIDSEAWTFYADAFFLVDGRTSASSATLTLEAKSTSDARSRLVLLSDSSANTFPFIQAITNAATIFSVDKNGVTTANRFDATGTPGDMRATTTVTATNAFRIIPPDNGGTSTANVPSPLGFFGSMMLSGTTNTVTIGSAGTYYTLTNYGTVRTNGFGANKATGFLTNTVAGYYRITVYASMIGGASDTMEGEVFLNETGREEISLFGSYDAPARVRTMSSTGILYIPANTGISFRLNNRSDTDNISVWRAAITVGTP